MFTTLYETSARREAEASDARVAAGKAIGPLDGRIVSIKDLFNVASEPTRAGSALLRRQPPATADAPVARRLRVAGAVIVGRTQMTEFAFSALGTNPHHPVAGNPHDRSRAPGGSSSGAVVSLVDGMAEIAIGSDTGGSIRVRPLRRGGIQADLRTRADYGRLLAVEHARQDRPHRPHHRRLRDHRCRPVRHVAAGARAADAGPAHCGAGPPLRRHRAGGHGRLSRRDSSGFAPPT